MIGSLRTYLLCLEKNKIKHLCYHRGLQSERLARKFTNSHGHIKTILLYKRKK